MFATLTSRYPVLQAWKFFLAIAIPIVLVPVPIFGQSSTSNAAYIVLVIAFYWVTEVVPIAVTALLPVVLFPLFDIQHTVWVIVTAHLKNLSLTTTMSLVTTFYEVLAQQYLKDSVQLFVGGLLVALAFEYCGLHKRVALRVMLFTGTSIGMLLLGIMLTTMFLSMWMFNTATTAMMVPIISSIVDELGKSMKQLCLEKDPIALPIVADPPENEYGQDLKGIVNAGFAVEPEIPKGRFGTVTFRPAMSPTPTPKKSPEELEKSITDMKTMLLLATCYSSNLGGTGVITGSGTNLVAIEFLGDLDPKHYGPYASLTFATWMGFNIFPMLVCILIAWIYLQIVFIGLPNKYRFWKSREERKVSNQIFSKEVETKIKGMLEENYAALKGFTIHEYGVLILFIIVVITWVLHDPKFIPGWGSWFARKVSISSSSLLIGILFFVIPKNDEFYRAFKSRDFTGVRFLPLLDYEFALKRFPWGVVLLLGGGYALSNGAKKAGLSTAIGQALTSLQFLPPSLIQLCCMILIGFVTEVASNTATASIVIPILLELSQELNIHPLYLTLPATTTCSYAFMLPVATPPNAIVYAAGNLKVSDMIKTGLFMNFACIFVLFITTNLYGGLFFNFSSYSYVP